MKSEANKNISRQGAKTQRIKNEKLGPSASLRDPHKKTLTPKLRFPEFRAKGEWKEVAVRETATVIAGQSPKGEYYNDTGNGMPFYQGKTDFGDVFLNPPTKWTTQVTRLALEDDILMSVRAPVGALNVSTQEICIGRGLAALRAKEDTWFLYYLLLQVNRLFVGNGGSVFDSINKSLIENTQIPFPPTKAEQQKIADCLSSLDELIAAAGRKLAALRDHKRGLMQQLLPQPGQTQPRLRFPEFRDKGEWKNEQLGTICKFVRGPFGGALKKEIFVSHGFAVYEQSHAIHGQLDTFRYFIDKDKYRKLKRFTVKSNDIIMSCSGTMGRFTLIPEDPIPGVINQALLKLTVGKSFNTFFILRALELPTNLSKMLKQSAGGAIKNVVGVKDLKAIEIPIPKSAEQQKIADCLTALDTLITAHAMKIETLKQHKRGLMQQLFPAPEETP